jgi:hypothetical protein
MCSGTTAVKENCNYASFIANKETKWPCVSAEHCAICV